MRLSFDGNPGNAGGLQFFLEMSGHGAAVALRGAAGDDQEISDIGLAREVDDGNILRLIVIQGIFHQLEHARGLDGPEHHVGAPGGRHRPGKAPPVAVKEGQRPQEDRVARQLVDDHLAERVEGVPPRVLEGLAVL